MNTYTTKDVTAILSTSSQTVKVWARRFAGFLSPTGSPGKGKWRSFTDADMAVFALVKAYTSAGRTFDDVDTALAAGQRGDVPAQPTALLISPPARLAALQSRLDDLTRELEQQRGQNALLREQVDQLRAELREAHKQIGRLEG